MTEYVNCSSLVGFFVCMVIRLLTTLLLNCWLCWSWFLFSSFWHRNKLCLNAAGLGFFVWVFFSPQSCILLTDYLHSNNWKGFNFFPTGCYFSWCPFCGSPCGWSQGPCAVMLCVLSASVIISRAGAGSSKCCFWCCVINVFLIRFFTLEDFPV